MVNEQRKSSLKVKCSLLKLFENIKIIFCCLKKKLIVVRQRDNLEIFFKNLLVEDQGITPNAPSYVEFLHQLHREIKNILD